MSGKVGSKHANPRREPVPYWVAVAHLLARIERLPCDRPIVPIVTIAERPDTAAAVGRPTPEQSAETPAPARKIHPGESVIRSVVSGEWVIVRLPVTGRG